MSSHDVCILVGLTLAAWGHLLLNEQLGVDALWRWIDDRFPPVMRSPAPVAGAALLLVGAGSVVAGTIA